MTKRPIRLLNLGALPGWETQAIYHALAERMDVDTPDTIILCRPATPYLCIGYHQVLENIFDSQVCASRGLPVFRRQIGGGATYLDSNQVFYQCIFHHSRMPVMLKDIYQFALSAPVRTLRRLGLPAELCETNEIEVAGRRIAGTGGGRIGEAVVVVGNLLLDFDFETMAAVWRTPHPSFRLLAAKALRESLTRLVEYPVKASIETINAMLIEDFIETLQRPFKSSELTPEEIAASLEKATEISCPSHPGELEGIPPLPLLRELKISARSFIRYDEAQKDGIGIKASFWLQGETIREAALESIPEQNWQSFAETLRGTPFKGWKDRL